jgi:hypothetical protein
MATSSFWDGLGTGLLQTGVGVLAGKESEKAMLERLKAARGPLYDQEIGLASKSLALAGGMDPKAAAAERFAAQQGLVAPSNEADEQALMRKLQAKGMLGVASHGAVPGTAQTPGVAMNPHMAALFAAQAGAKNKAAYDSLNQGEAYLDNLLKRSNTLQSGANQRAAQVYQMTPAKQSTSSRLLQGAGSLLGNADISKAIGGLFSGMFGKSTPTAPAARMPAPMAPPVSDYSFDFSPDYADYDFGPGYNDDLDWDW